MAPVHASKVFTAVQKKPPHSYKRNAAVFGLVTVEAGRMGRRYLYLRETSRSHLLTALSVTPI